MTEIKLTDKEEKVVASIVSFFQGYRDCPKENKEKFILDNAFMARNIIAFKNLDPKNAYVLLSSTIIHNIIPYLVAKDEEKIDDVAFGFDALNLEYCDMFKKGIIDPTKVTRTALENAVSVASSILTTECVVVNKENKKSK